MPRTFLSDVIIDVFAKKPIVENLVFILPSKRAGVFLQKQISKQIQAATFAPKVYSIEDFIAEIAEITTVKNTQLLFEFYAVYLKNTPKQDTEDFYTFCKWAQIILQDFNEIDRYLIDPEEIFSYLESIQEINHWYLQEEKTELQQNYIAFWNHLTQYYQSLKEALLEKNIGYQGLVYRQAAQNCSKYIQNNTDKQFVFIGFNALNNAEQHIIQEILKTNNADIYWDIDQAFLKDTQHDAGLFIRSYLKNWPYFKTNPLKWPNQEYTAAKNIHLVGVPKNIGQAKYVGNLLEEIPLEKRKHTAVIFANEPMLIPMLNAVPAQIQNINITMGYPIVQTPMASFFSLYYTLYEKEQEKWYYKEVENLLTHPFSTVLLKEHGLAIVAKIQGQNKVYLTQKDIIALIPENVSAHIYEIITTLFLETTDVTSLINASRSLIFHLKTYFEQDKTQHALALEYLLKFYELFNQIIFLNEKYPFLTDITSFYGVYKELLHAETLDFEGEPLEGLQMMGMLESRNLDFQTVILTSVNEGILPSGKSNNSFIPFDIKKRFGLPTYKEKDAIYTYHFYRLLQRAKQVHILYNTEADALEGGEKSRFLLQLAMEKQPNHNIIEHIASPKVTQEQQEPTQIIKSNAIIQKLRDMATKGFSPSALSNYIRNPFDFYLQNILGLKEADVVEETIAANTLGTIIHDTLEELYTPFIHATLSLEVLTLLQKKATTILTKHFALAYPGGDFATGKNHIIFTIATHYVRSFLAQEKKLISAGKKIEILALEKAIQTQVHFTDKRLGSITFKGKIDRIDRVDGTLRVIDYKTGKVMAKDLEITHWDTLTTDYGYSKAFQLLLYAYMLEKEGFLKEEAEIGVISFKNLKAGFLKFGVKQAGSRKKDYGVTRETLACFAIELEKLIREILNPEIAITEKQIESL